MIFKLSVYNFLHLMWHWIFKKNTRTHLSLPADGNKAQSIFAEADTGFIYDAQKVLFLILH